MNIDQIRHTVEPLIHQLEQHKIYDAIRSDQDVKTFMSHHIFAVWDFMNLAKVLQHVIAPSNAPWIPNSCPTDITRFINEIILDEESDRVFNDSKVSSHFGLYLEAMNQIGADTKGIKSFITHLEEHCSILSALTLSHADPGVIKFVSYNDRLIQPDKPHVVAAAFAFGREIPLPKIFTRILEVMERHNMDCVIFKEYLERHIELDGDKHSHLAEQMVSHFCGGDSYKWVEAISAANMALKTRLVFWDYIERELRSKQSALINDNRIF